MHDLDLQYNTSSTRLVVCNSRPVYTESRICVVKEAVISSFEY